MLQVLQVYIATAQHDITKPRSRIEQIGLQLNGHCVQRGWVHGPRPGSVTIPP